jgi:hypothetical protein
MHRKEECQWRVRRSVRYRRRTMIFVSPDGKGGRDFGGRGRIEKLASDQRTKHGQTRHAYLIPLTRRLPSPWRDNPEILQLDQTEEEGWIQSLPRRLHRTPRPPTSPRRCLHSRRPQRSPRALRRGSRRRPPPQRHMRTPPRTQWPARIHTRTKTVASPLSATDLARG